jgi:hypothetical protein
MARTSKTPAELEEAARHVGYEMRMLLFSSQHLEGWYASPITVDEDDANMVLESFLLHFRNLRTFLCPSTQKLTSPDDVIASDFTTGDGVRRRRRNELRIGEATYRQDAGTRFVYTGHLHCEQPLLLGGRKHGDLGVG